MHFQTARQFNYFTSCTTADGLHYVATSKDEAILGQMYIKRQNYSADTIEAFYLLTKNFYNVDDSKGIFLDIGANIGTTGIYFLKKFVSNLKLLAFEPDPENFKLLRANLILNDMEEKTVVENYGLGDVESEMTMYRVPENPGMNRLFKDQFGKGTENVSIIQLDKYFDEKNISAKDVKYIWIDTEGFEAQVLLGMKNILTENSAPIFMEFNPLLYKKSGYFDRMMTFLSAFYSSYVLVQETLRTQQIIVESIEKLWEYKDYPRQLGDIFLIHKVKGVVE